MSSHCHNAAAELGHVIPTDMVLDKHGSLQHNRTGGRIFRREPWPGDSPSAGCRWHRMHTG